MILRYFTSVFIGLLFLISPFILYSQIGITNTAPNNNPTHLIQNVLVGGGVSISNVSFTGNSQQIGYFSSGNSIGMSSGIVMTSGHALDADLGGSPNSFNTPASGNQCATNPNTVCNDLYSVANSVPAMIGQFFSVSDINDMCVLEFDFVPESDTVQFNYSFGSEEYLSWVNSSYNDVFGFFISGPGITGPYSSPAGFPGGSQNIAVVPNSTPPLPITVSSVHPGYNGQYYNTGNSTISYNGYTDVFTAIANVIPCETYHIRLAIADGSDDFLDSGVFLEANSFNSQPVSIGTFGVSISTDTLFIPCNGTIDLEAQISGAFNILWNTGASTSIINVGEGQYYFTASGLGSCVLYSDTVTIVEQSIINTSTIISDLSCPGLLDGSVDLSVSGGVPPYQYSWIDSTTGSIFNTQDLVNIPAGIYWCTVLDNNGCGPEPFSVTVLEPSAINVSVNTNDVSCYGGSDGSAILTLTGGTSPLMVSWTGPNSFSTTSTILTNLSAGTYFANITDNNNCPPIVETVTINEPNLLAASYLTTQISCFGQSDGAIDLSVTGGTQPYSYFWLGPNGFFSTNEDISLLDGGSYTLSMTDANNCSLSNSVSVIINEPQEISLVANIVDVSCFGSQDGAIDLNITGGVGFITTTWTYPDGSLVLSEDINSLGGGVYNYNITDVNGCSISSSGSPIIVVEPSEIVVSSTQQDESCYGDNNGEINITISNASGPFTFNWIGPNGFTSSLEDIIGLSAGSYTFSVTDVIGCQKQENYVINTGLLLQLDTMVYDVTCNGYQDGFINITPYGLINPNYIWSNGSTSEDVTGLSSGNYTLLVNDINNCPSFYSFDIEEPEVLTVLAVINDESCSGTNDGEILVSASGGTSPYNYIWSNGVQTFNNSFLSKGQYIISLLDNNSCILTDTFNVDAFSYDAISIISENRCFGDSTGFIDLDILGGNYPYTYSWSNGSNTQDLVNVPAGTYLLTITDAANCSLDTLFTIGQPSNLNSVSFTTSVSCFGFNDGTAQLQLAGGVTPYSVDWFGNDPMYLGAGNHFYSFTDANGCIYNGSVNISQADSIIVSYNKIDVKCFGEENGMIDIIVQSGGVPPYSFSWVGPNLFTSTDQDISNLSAGLYTLNITDDNNCNKLITVPIDEPTPLAQQVNVSTSDYTGYNIGCKGDNSGWIAINVSGGYIPYSYLWSNGSNSDSISNLYAGNYSVTLTDGLGCTADFSLSLNEPLTHVSGILNTTSDYNGYEISCYGEDNGSLEVLASGGVSGYTYSWSNGYNNSILTGLSAGYYEVLVYDNNSCLWIDSVTLHQPDSLQMSLISATDTCERSVGMAAANVDGGVSPYSYSWSSGDLSSVVDNFYSGSYNILVSDDNSCLISADVTIGNLQSPDIDFTTNPSRKRFYDQLENPFIFIDVSNTYWQSIANWYWDFGDGNFSQDSIASHSYTNMGDYSVWLVVETEFNCVDSIYKQVRVDDFDIFIPNSFTPADNDDINQIFKPYGFGIDSFNMRIYSRWGELLFSTDDYNTGWDGRKQGSNELCISGIYTYYIEVENIYGEIFKYEGVLNLFR